MEVWEVIAKAWEASERLRVRVDLQQGIRAMKLGFALDRGTETSLQCQIIRGTDLH